MPETKFILIRHGETEWNTRGRWQGHKNSPLTQNGIDQAKAVARRLKEIPFSTLYSSHLGRAMQTAQAISDATGNEIIEVPGVSERSSGVFEGLTVEEIKEKYPAEYKHFKADNPDYVMPGGESTRQHENRIMESFNVLAARHPHDTIVVVTHGGVLNRVFRAVTGLAIDAPRNFKIMNTSINVIVCNNGAWELHTWGDIYHLERLQSLDEV